MGKIYIYILWFIRMHFYLNHKFVCQSNLILCNKHESIAFIHVGISLFNDRGSTDILYINLS